MTSHPRKKDFCALGIFRNRFASHPRFAKRLEVCEPGSGEILIEADQRISHVYFPETAVVSLVVPIDKQKCIEVAIVSCPDALRAAAHGLRCGGEAPTGRAD